VVPSAFMSPAHLLRSSLLAIPLLLLTSGCQSEPLSIEGVEIVDNPDNLLSCWVRWSTNLPASSWVHYQVEDGGGWFAAGSDDETQEHEVLVLGLRPVNGHRLRATSQAADGQVAFSEDLGYPTGPLPFAVPRIQVTVHDAHRVQPGWTLMNMVVDNSFPPTVALMLDAQGHVVWYHTLGDAQGAAGVETSLVAGDQVLIGGNIAPGETPVQVNLAGDVVWEGPMQLESGLFTSGTMHHTFQRLPNGDYVTMLFEMYEGHLQDVIWQFDAELETTWEWHAIDHIPETEIDRLHGNIVQVDLEEDVAYFHSRDLSALYKIDRADGAILWTLREGGDFTMLGDHPDPWWLRAHAPEILPDGHLLLHDNGGSEKRPYTRIIEYEVDQQAMTIQPVWQFPQEGSEDTWFAKVWGDADRLPNGNTLFCSGTAFANDAPGRVAEVTPEGEVVWELRFESEDGGPAAPYMIQRVEAPVMEL
jgi:Arylsulfotransferase (ASST)